MTQSSPQDNTKPTLPLELVISEMTEHELDKIDSAVESIVKSASKLSQSSISDLAAYWATEATSARNAAIAVASVTPADIPKDSESYCSVKDALVQTLIFEKSASKLNAGKQDTENIFNRKVGESVNEYKTRINAYLNDLDN